MTYVRRKSRGIALLTTLLLVSIASIIAVSLIKRQWIDIRKTQNTQQIEQSWMYAQAVEAWALGRLYDDSNKNDIDSKKDSWAYPIEPTDIEGGQISAVIVDSQSKFNINNLLAEKETGKKYQDRFKRLLKVLDLPEELLGAVLDWIDADSNIHNPGGAEDSHYMLLDKPYRSANQEIVDVSELRLIEGFSDEVYQRLKPYVSALPGVVYINVNTASEPVLRSLAEDISETDAQLIIDVRSDEPFEGVQSFIQHQALAGRTIVADGLSVTSQYYRVDSKVLIDNYTMGYTSLIYREDKENIRVVQRAKRGLFDEQ
jgi:general secretion pathway protein K